MKRQFIAGAVCPHCQALDKIVLITEKVGEENSRRYYECIECGVSRSDEEFAEPSSSIAASITEVQKVKFIDPQDEK